MKLFISISILIVFSISSMAQNAVIKGKITNSLGKPAEFLTIQLKGTSKGATSDETGEYKIDNINAGSYTLEVTGIGIQKRTETIVIARGQHIYTVDFTVEENI